MTHLGHITLSQFQADIKQVLAAGLPSSTWIVAEIGEMKVNYSSGHCYLELVEKGRDNGVPKAKASAVIWRQTYGMLSSYFSGATGQQLAAGLKVLVKVCVTYHELYGLSLQITDIDPLYTVGDMERQRQLTISQLKQDGVYDLNRSLEMAAFPQRIAVISSPGAAGYRDFIKELEAGGYRFEVGLFEAVMQGHGAEESIIGALERVAAAMDRYDALVIIRGGGSQSDLSFLNSYLLSFHIAQFPLPVVAGLGHDKDQSVVDMVAALSLKTPTAVAGFFVARAAELDDAICAMEKSLSLAAPQLLLREGQRLSRLSESIARKSGELTHGLQLRLLRLEGEAARRKEYLLVRQRARLDALHELLGERTLSLLKNSRTRLDNTLAVVEGRDPQVILSMGFAMVRSAGKTIRDVSEVNPGDELDITLRDGVIRAVADKSIEAENMINANN